MLLVVHPTARILAGVLGLLLIRCSLTIDEKELGGKHLLDCASNQKECNVQGVLKCVGVDDPRFGCAAESCIPCNLPNATARCGLTGTCVKVACHPSYEDCNNEAADGCEAPLNNSVEHCGACDEGCPSPKELRNVARIACGSGHCYILECNEGFLNCNGKLDDGCEVDEHDPDHCGECGEPCGGSCCVNQCCGGSCQVGACSE